jgi:HEAT repeat protein
LNCQGCSFLALNSAPGTSVWPFTNFLQYETLLAAYTVNKNRTDNKEQNMRSVFVSVVGLVYILISASYIAAGGNDTEKAVVEAADRWAYAVRNKIETQTELRKELKQHGSAAYDLLSKLYDSEQFANHYFLREGALKTMVEIDPSRAINFIETNVFVNSPSNLKSSACYMLGKLASPDSIKLLIRRFEAKDSRDRANARMGISNAGGAAVNAVLDALVNGSDQTRTEAALSLRYLNLSKAVEARIADVMMQRLNDPCPEVRRALVSCLHNYDKVGFKRCLQDEDIVVRLAAFTWIRSMRDQSYPDLVIRAAKDPIPEIRRQVALALKDQSVKSAVQTLLGMLSDDDEQVRINARRSLIGRKGTFEQEMIKPLLTDADPENRATAVALLAKCDPAPIKQILAIARNENSDEAMRKSATNAILAHAENPIVLDFVRELFEDPERLGWANGYRQFQPWPFSMGWKFIERPGAGAAMALIQHGDIKDAVRIVNSIRDGHVDPWLSALLYEMGEKAIPALEIAIQTEDATIRQAALSSLGRFASNKEALKLVRSALGDKDANVRGNAAVTLGCMGDADSVGLLLGLLKDDNEYARRYAATALVMLGDKRGEKIAFDWHKKQFKKFGYLSGLFLLKYAVPLGSTKQRAAEIFSLPAGTNGEGNHWSYSPSRSMCISLTFKDGVLTEIFPAQKDWGKTFP